MSKHYYLTINNVSKSFSSVSVLKNIQFEMKQGELFSILGPSGCGKTTLLRIIAGFEKPDSGSIYLNHHDITNVQPANRNIGIVFQSYALFPNLTAKENISFGLKNKKISKAEKIDRIEYMIDLIGLRGNELKYPKQLSGGQQQRVALARSLILSPDLLLLDEPLSALDTKVREKLRYDIKALLKQFNSTALLVTHDQGEAMSMSDEILVMNKGEIVQKGGSNEIYNKPGDLFTANFIGSLNCFKVNDFASHPYFKSIMTSHLMKDKIYDIAIRPENIMCNKSNENESGLKVSVINIELRGIFYRIKCKLEDFTQKEYLIDIDLSHKEINDLELKPGSILSLQLDTRNCMFFDMEGKSLEYVE